MHVYVALVIGKRKIHLEDTPNRPPDLDEINGKEREGRAPQPASRLFAVIHTSDPPISRTLWMLSTCELHFPSGPPRGEDRRRPRLPMLLGQFLRGEAAGALERALRAALQEEVEAVRLAP